jgi:hypothetical protein
MGLNMFNTGMSNDYRYWSAMLREDSKSGFWINLFINSLVVEDEILFYDPSQYIRKKAGNGWFYQWATTFNEDVEVPQMAKDILWEAALRDDNYDSLLLEIHGILNKEEEVTND